MPKALGDNTVLDPCIMHTVVFQEGDNPACGLEQAKPKQ